MLVLVVTAVSGCGKKEEKNQSNVVDNSINDGHVDSNITSDSQTGLEEEDDLESNTIENQMSVEDIRNLNPYVISVNRFAEDELGRNVTGYMSIDYVEIDENSQALCPELTKSLEQFNNKRKKDFVDSYERFNEAANKYAEYYFEATHSEEEYVDSKEPETCIDYEFIDVMRADSVATSLLITYTDFLGTGSLKTMYVGATFDSQTGEQLDINDVVVDWSAYKNAILTEMERKYESVKASDTDPTDYLGWVLTPEGIIIYYPDGYVSTAKEGEKSVQINFDEYPEVFNKKYTIAPSEYTIPINADDVFYMDVDGDLIREAVIYSPEDSGVYADSGEYPTYEITVNDRLYNNFEEEWFYGYRPYYVHRNDGNYIYVYTEGYGSDYICVNKFVGDEPICVAKLPATPFYVENLDETDEEFINRHIAFSHPDMVHKALDFDRNVCGTYRGDEGAGAEKRYWDICKIDDRYYLEYIGEYDYSAAEIELLDENPYQAGDELRYMVRVYPYSGFSFGGEFQGAGEVMYITAKLGDGGRRIELSPDNPFFYCLQTMYALEDVNMHEIQDNSKSNKIAPEIIGAWRSQAEADSISYDVFMEFYEDGRVDIVKKSECYTPMVYRGIYNLEKKGSIYSGTIEAEAMGMGRQPVADWNIEFDPSSDSPIKITGEYEDDNPLVYGVADMGFFKTEPGKRDKYIHPGPWKRTDEVVEMYDEYTFNDEYGFEYDFQPEYVEAIINRAVELADGTSYVTYGIQDNKNGGEIWVKVLYDAMPSVQVTKNWVKYNMAEGSYCDIHDQYLDEEY